MVLTILQEAETKVNSFLLHRAFMAKASTRTACMVLESANMASLDKGMAEGSKSHLSPLGHLLD